MARARAQSDTVTEIKGLPQLLRVLNKIPKDLQAEVRDASGEIAADLVSGAQNAAHTPLQLKVAGALKVKRDRVPVVRAGGKTSDGTPVKDLFYGAEFGGGRRSTTQQFPTHRGRLGYFLYPTARARGRKYAEKWAEAVDKAFKDWDYKAR
jgi:hypothetical protein